jgi:hypothetical protein
MSKESSTNLYHNSGSSKTKCTWPPKCQKKILQHKWDNSWEDRALWTTQIQDSDLYKMLV